MKLLEEVRKKREYNLLCDDLVSRVLVKVSSKYDIMDPKDHKKIVKETRARLRELYGAFRLRGYNKKEKFLEEMGRWDDEEVSEKILALHMSTKERIDFNGELYLKIREYVKFNSVLDLGCGFNVFSMPWMGKVQYYGIDVNKEDVDFCNAYLTKFGIGGGVRWGDVLSFEKKFLHADVTFMFKVLEGFESLEKGVTERLLKMISSKYIIVSFATKSMGGGKRISARRLKWFEKLVDIEDKFEIGDEIYYVVKNN